MNKIRALAIFITFFICHNSKCQTSEEFDEFAQNILEEAELLYSLIKATEESSKKFESNSTLSYKLPNGNIRSITWQDRDLVDASIDFGQDLTVLDHTNDPRELTSDESLLVEAFVKIQEIIESGDLDLDEGNTVLKPAFTFDHKLQNPDIEHSDTQLVVYLIRDDEDDNAVPMGSDFYVEFDALGGMKDIYSIDSDYFFPSGSNLYKGEEVSGLIHGHSVNDPIISATEIASIMLHRSVVEWDNLTVTRDLSDSTFTESVYDVKNHTLSILEKPNKDFDYIPTWCLMVIYENKRFIKYLDSGEEIDPLFENRADDSWWKSVRIYEPEQAAQEYPEVTSGRLGIFELTLKRNKLKVFPEHLPPLPQVFQLRACVKA